jgi:hypothetical protein
MALTQPAKFDVNKAIAHLREKWAGSPCPMCRVTNWNVQDSIYQLPQFNPIGMVVGGSLIPVIPVSCGNCGNTILVNAIKAGVWINPGGQP